MRWFKTGGELHYIPLEKLPTLNTENIDGTFGAFLPSNVLDLAYKVLKHVIGSVTSLVLLYLVGVQRKKWKDTILNIQTNSITQCCLIVT